jgi:hypothetical protein
LVANCSSRPSRVRRCGVAVTPALATRMCSGPRQEVTNRAMMAIGGVTLIAGHEHQRALADRLLDLVLAGLRNRP